MPAILDAITYCALRGQAANAPLRPQTAARLALALRMVQRPSYQLASPKEELEGSVATRSVARRRARHARTQADFRHRTTLLRRAS